jgi:phosphoenolpyruvate carboxykinase (GTP)
MLCGVHVPRFAGIGFSLPILAGAAGTQAEPMKAKTGSCLPTGVERHQHARPKVNGTNCRRTIMKRYGTSYATNPVLIGWVEEIAKLCKPDQIFWCDGSEGERALLAGRAIEQGVLAPLDHEKWPGCYYHRSKSNDVARVEQCTYICTSTENEAGPTNNWAAPSEMYEKLYGLCRGAMRGRTMFVVPYLMGPPGSPLTKVGVELTDSI